MGQVGTVNFLYWVNADQQQRDFFVLPSVLSVISKQKIIVLAICPDPLCFIPQGLVIAQAILLPEQDSDNTPESLAMWTQVISCHRPELDSTLECNNKRITLKGLVDTGWDVTVISKDYWPPEWTLIPASEILSIIEGNSSSYKSTNLIKCEDPEGRIATTRPFVVRTKTPIVLWGGTSCPNGEHRLKQIFRCSHWDAWHPKIDLDNRNTNMDGS